MNELNLDLREIKRTLASKVGHCKLIGTNHTYFNIHGLNIRFSYDSLRMKSWIEAILESYNIAPAKNQTSAETVISVSWQSPSGLSDLQLANWNEDPDPNLEIFRLGKNEVAIQRDFMGLIDGSKNISVYLQPEFNDGFYNALRWFMPRFLLIKNSVMMHSSCLVGLDTQAHLFLGQSGIGKTTTVSRAKDRLILGDDMILISFDGARAFAETPILGQNPKFKGQAGTRYPIAGFYFLEQASGVSKTAMANLDALKSFLMSLMYPTWNTVTEVETNTLTRLAQNFLRSAPSYKLKLDRETPFLGVIDDHHR